MVLTAGLGIVVLFCVEGQIKKFYSLSEVSTFDTVDFNLEATSGICFIRHVDGGNPLSIFGNPNLDRINPSFDAITADRKCGVNLRLDEFRQSGLGDGLAFAVLKENEESEENFWKFLLNNSKVYNLDLHFGIGNTDIDLSGTRTCKMKVRTGSADVQVSYERGEANLTEMDTFLVKIDVGTFEGKMLGKARADQMITEVGFGKARLDFAEGILKNCVVDASVGAGKLTVILPKDSPVIIKVKESPLCSVRLPKDYDEIENNIHVNKAYSVNSPEILTLNVDVALGSIDFVYSDDKK